MEITVDSPESFEIIQRLARKYGDQAVIGAGTVLDGQTARMAIHHGAEFIFSPNLKQDVIQTALRYGKQPVPGIFTPTEIVQAVEWGAQLVKLFPASSVGANFIKDVMAPLPHVSIIPTGGVNLENAAEFIAAGAVAVGIGRNLVPSWDDYEGIESRAREYVALIQAARNRS